MLDKFLLHSIWKFFTMTPKAKATKVKMDKAYIKIKDFCELDWVFGIAVRISL